MNSNAILIGKSNINIPTLLQLGKQAYGRNIAQKLDRDCNKNEHLKFMAILDEIKTQNCTLTYYTSDILCHLSFTFLVVLDNDSMISFLSYGKIATIGNWTIHNSLYCAVITTNLADWKSLIVDLTTGEESYGLRLLAQRLMLGFEQEGLGSIFEEYAKQSRPDGTFRLQIK